MLKSHTDDVLTTDDEVRLPGMRFPVRMTVVRLRDGGLWLHSPVRCTEALAAEVAALGPVKYLVAPSLLHHLFIGEWAARFPEAKLWAAADLDRKRGDLRVDGVHG